MRRIFLLILALAILLPITAQAYDVLVLQSRRDSVCNDLLKGFNAEHPGSQRVIVISEYAEIDTVRIVREEHPRLILAIGDAALKEARKVRQTPVVALMTLGLKAQAAIQPNLTGVSMLPEPESYLSLFQTMKARRVGLIVNPAGNGGYLKRAHLVASEMGVEIVVAEAATPQAALGELETLAGKVDALWMLPDPTIICRKTVESWFRFAHENNIPVVSFSSAFLAKGATAVVDIDRCKAGREAGRIANRAIEGEILPVQPAEGIIKVNPAQLERYRIHLPLPPN